MNITGSHYSTGCSGMRNGNRKNLRWFSSVYLEYVTRGFLKHWAQRFKLAGTMGVLSECFTWLPWCSQVKMTGCEPYTKLGSCCYIRLNCRPPTHWAQAATAGRGSGVFCLWVSVSESCCHSSRGPGFVFKTSHELVTWVESLTLVSLRKVSS